MSTNPFEIEHLFLVRAEDQKQAIRKLRGFLDSYKLVSYDRVEVKKDEIIPGVHPLFHEKAQEGMRKNRETVKDFLAVISQEGYGDFEDIADIPQGFLSKIFHTVAHLLDGFFGIDSYFFNLEEDSHWISRRLQRQIEKEPASFWLLKIVGHGRNYDVLSQMAINNERL